MRVPARSALVVLSLSLFVTACAGPEPLDAPAAQHAALLPAPEPVTELEPVVAAQADFRADRKSVV